MSRTRTSLTGLACALACVLAAALLIAGPAAAASRGYKIYNRSSHDLKLESVGDLIHFNGRPLPRAWEGRPDDGSVLKPGADPHDWELVYDFLIERGATLTYGIVGTDQHYVATIFSDQISNNSTCSIPASLGRCTAEGRTLTVTDPPGTRHLIRAGNAQKQANTLRELCSTTNATRCDFTSTNEEHGTAPARLVGDPAVNCQGRDVEDRITRTDTLGESNSIGIRSTAKTNYIVEKARGSVTTKYRHNWTQAHAFKQNLTLTVKPGDMAWVTSAAPIYRDTGNFVLTLGNTTWTLKDIQFDTPDPTQTAEFTVAERALAPAEYKEECTHTAGETGLTDAPASWVSTHRIGSGGHNRMVGGRSSDTMRGLGGNDTIVGGAGHDGLFGGRGNDRLLGGPGTDLLFGGPGNDTLIGGPGRDTIYGGPGADVILDFSGPTVVDTGHNTGLGMDRVNVRDGRGDDTVYCQTRRTLVVADRHDRIRGACGKVIRGHGR